ncbi:MAG: Crp/Fnr family transcriptional regulator [Bradyrhizobium sp.]|uniref:Crp/Fnr family transcriptional regulator n=1 Tax=Bradyrhizobium sp. TaxID=376 RepID=UPI001C286476|nr:Crp/Fnr family transcriptional regulator [Bradyrhizobium sp.]MBU6463599.1 Crp/Fnr family transcriptional regulator [Pseudomonadota bacterium]MDE2067015.1 Crp/Fnr family transcriptional regulator [Bradyrhizobium sp.]MDE2472396.1 Crp/Fnr family transcriptional regulator [Bradyrhizobium sp.]
MEQSTGSLLRLFDPSGAERFRNGDLGLSASSNELVLRLSDVSRRLLLERCERVSLCKRQVLYDRGIPLQHAYFIESGGASVTTRAGGCLPVEIHTLGKKDFVGVPLVLGMRASPHRCAVQIPGQALRIFAEDLISLIKLNVEVEKLLLRYVQGVLIHSSQLVACNSRHGLLQRLARWLVVASERLGSRDIPFTHGYIANSLAVRRAGVTVAIGALVCEGVIESRRGQIVVLDPVRLKALSCDCQSVILSAHERSLTMAPPIRIAYSK